mmetsp:Transcript_44113/g.86533  ORF Transcript_44113/g.86533 Transcript_44113/m.86533 type:complete len:219 (-) Transcript_44113:338-994(-)
MRQATLYLLSLCISTIVLLGGLQYSHGFCANIPIRLSKTKGTKHRNSVAFPLRIDNNDNNSGGPDRDAFGRFARGLVRSGTEETVGVGSIVIARADLPSSGVWIDQSYELRSIYWQGPLEDGLVAPPRIPSKVLDGDLPPGPEYVKYVKLYSPMYHQERGEVIVTPEEAGLVTLKEEVFDSFIVALPILGFWTSLCFVFASKYNDRYGGDFWDAFFGR